MKIKKSELEKIILEETLKLLNEQVDPAQAAQNLKRLMIRAFDADARRSADLSSQGRAGAVLGKPYRVFREAVLKNTQLYVRVLQTMDEKIAKSGKAAMNIGTIYDAFDDAIQDTVDDPLVNRKTIKMAGSQKELEDLLSKFSSSLLGDDDELDAIQAILKNVNSTVIKSYFRFERSGRTLGAPAAAAPAAAGSGPMTPAQLQQLQDPYGIGKMAAGFGVSKPGSPGGAAATPKAGKKGISKTAKQKSLLRRADAFGGSLQRLQQFLGNSGYFGSPDIRDAKETFRKGPQNPDGKYGEETEEAIKYLQKILGVKQDGWYGKNTHKAWKASNWKKSPEGEAASAKAKPDRRSPYEKGIGALDAIRRSIAAAEKEN